MDETKKPKMVWYCDGCEKKAEECYVETEETRTVNGRNYYKLLPEGEWDFHEWEGDDNYDVGQDTEETSEKMCSISDTELSEITEDEYMLKKL